MGRTARGDGGRGNALLFLLPEELAFLRFLKQAKVCIGVQCVLEYSVCWSTVCVEYGVCWEYGVCGVQCVLGVRCVLGVQCVLEYSMCEVRCVLGYYT